jgi:hypothetical protein
VCVQVKWKGSSLPAASQRSRPASASGLRSSKNSSSVPGIASRAHRPFRGARKAAPGQAAIPGHSDPEVLGSANTILAPKGSGVPAANVGEAAGERAKPGEKRKRIGGRSGAAKDPGAAAKLDSAGGQSISTGVVASGKSSAGLKRAKLGVPGVLEENQGEPRWEALGEGSAAGGGVALGGAESKPFKPSAGSGKRAKVGLAVVSEDNGQGELRGKTAGEGTAVALGGVEFKPNKPSAGSQKRAKVGVAGVSTDDGQRELRGKAAVEGIAAGGGMALGGAEPQLFKPSAGSQERVEVGEACVLEERQGKPRGEAEVKESAAGDGVAFKMAGLLAGGGARDKASPGEKLAGGKLAEATNAEGSMATSTGKLHTVKLRWAGEL